jgi:hypothetical protein
MVYLYKAQKQSSLNETVGLMWADSNLLNSKTVGEVDLPAM